MATEQQKAVKNFKKFMRGLDEIDRVSEDDRENHQGGGKGDFGRSR